CAFALRGMAMRWVPAMGVVTMAIAACATSGARDTFGDESDAAADGGGGSFGNDEAGGDGAGGDGSTTTTTTIYANTDDTLYGLAFAPAGLLGSGEMLVGGDGDGELWTIDASTGATKDLGSFGPDKTNVFALSGDIVFYSDASGKPTGLATIRSCKSGGTNCI